jgi:hypothetical protein
MSDEEFLARFEDASLPNELFHHGDHVRMAFLYLRRYPALEALQRFSGALAQFAAAKGKPDLYSETITWAFFLLIRERMVRAGSEQNWAQFATSNQDLLSWQDNALRKYYREETLKSELAKEVFLFPDRTCG